MTAITVNSEAHWHEIRAKHVGASEAAALFGVSPWETVWQLHMRKRGKLAATDMSQNVAVQAGVHMEPALAGWAAERWGMSLRKVRRYLECDDCPGLGASLDYEEYGAGLLVPVEIKWSLWGKEWEWDGDEITDFPLNYGVQVQAQMACAGASSAWLIAFCGGDLRRCRIDAIPSMIADLKTLTTQFWDDVRAEREPPIDFTKDAEAVTSLYQVAEDRIVDLTTDNRAVELCAQYRDAAERETAAKANKDAAKAELLTKIGTAKAAKAGQYKITASMVAPNTGTLVTPEMVGTYVNARSGYRRVAVSELKAKKE